MWSGGGLGEKGTPMGLIKSHPADQQATFRPSWHPHDTLAIGKEEIRYFLSLPD